MKRKILWLTLWTTLVCWFGQGAGCQAPSKPPLVSEDTVEVIANACSKSARSDKPEPSITSLDRSHWPRTPITPADGRVAHYPVYFDGIVLPRNEAPSGPFVDEADKLRASLDGAKAANWDRTNVLHMLIDPPKFGLDLLLLPVRVVATPTWKQQTTP